MLAHMLGGFLKLLCDIVLSYLRMLTLQWKEHAENVVESKNRFLAIFLESLTAERSNSGRKAKEL
jgi:hypothetical protein